MEAIRVESFGHPEVMKIQEVPVPQPESGEVLVRIRAAGVNPVDTYIRSGRYSTLPDLPYTPGLEGAGVIEALGPDTAGFSVGDRVYVAGSINGTYAEFALCSAAQVHPLPRSLSFAQGAAIHVAYATAELALFPRGRAAKGQTVLIHGASGGVGTAAVQRAKSAGLTVIATAGSATGGALVVDQGADRVLDHHDSNHWDQIMDLTHGEGVDVIIEMLANINLARDLQVLAQKGRVVVVGSRGPIEIDPREAMKRDATIVGMMVMNASEAEKAQIIQSINQGLKRGIIKPVVGKEIPLHDASRAHHEVIEQPAYGKIVLIP